MTPKEDTGSPAPTQADPLCLLLPLGLWLEIPDTWANRRGIMILLRCLRRDDGRPLVTYEHMAQALGYADRRNVHNYWAEFAACGHDLLAYLSRRKKVDAEVVACCEQIWQAHPLWSPVQVHAEVVRRLPQKGATLSVPNIRTAGQQVGFLGVQQTLRRQVAEGQAHYKEEALIEALFALAEAQVAHAPQVHAPIPEVLEQVLPAVGLGQEVPQIAAQVARLEDQLLTGDASPQALATLWQGPLGGLLLSFVLYYHGLSLGVLGQFWGVHKTTVMRWLAPLATVNWRAVVQQGRQYFSGLVAVDEKWVKIAGVWWYLFAAVDHVSGLPLHVALLPANSGAYCKLFLLQLKQLGYVPKVIITDGWDAYVTAIAQVFPQAQHLLCRFHALRAAFRRLKVALANGAERHLWMGKLSRAFHTTDKRTVRCRLQTLHNKQQIRRWRACSPDWLPNCRSCCQRWAPPFGLRPAMRWSTFLPPLSGSTGSRGRSRTRPRRRSIWPCFCWATSLASAQLRPQTYTRDAAPCNRRAIGSGRCRYFICSIGLTSASYATASPNALPRPPEQGRRRDVPPDDHPSSCEPWPQRQRASLSKTGLYCTS